MKLLPGILAACVLVALLSPSGAAASECTNSWTGPSEGSWQTAGNWSAGHYPTETEVACIGAGNSVSSAGTNQVAEVHVAGTLRVTGGSFQVLDTEEPSTVNDLRVESGSLTGPATIKVTGTLRWWSTMAGSGTTVIEPEAEAKVTGYWSYLQGRTLVNEGVLRMEEEGTIRQSESSILENKGTIYANSVVSYARFPGIYAEGGSPKVVNQGTILRTASSEAWLNINVENYGTINAQTGTLKLEQGSGVGLWASGSVVKGKLHVSGPTITLESVDADEAELSGGSTFYAAEGETAVLGDAEVAVHSGPGTIEIAGDVGYMSALSGAGTTVIRPGAEMKVTSYWTSLKGRTLVNEGALRMEAEGSIRQSEGAILENKGTIYANSVVSYARFPGIFDEGGSPKVVNDGTILKSVASETRLSINVENYGTINAQAGALHFEQGSGVGLWASGSVVKGKIVVSGPTITAESVDATEINLSGSSTLTAAAGETPQLGHTEIANLTGPGTFEITGSASWWSWSGAGSTVIKPGAEVKVSSYWTYLKGRTVVNEGTLTMEGEGTIRQSESAVIENEGTIKADSVVSYARFVGIYNEGGASKVVNNGTIRKSKSSEFRFDTSLTNYGTVEVEADKMLFETEGTLAELKPESTLEGAFVFEGPLVTADDISASDAEISVWGKSAMIVEGDIQVAGLTIGYSPGPVTLTGGGDLEVTDKFHWGGTSTIAGTGELLLGPESVNKIEAGNIVHTLKERRLVNKGVLSQVGSDLLHMENGARLVNLGVYNADSWPYCRCSAVIIERTGSGAEPRFVNRGLFRRTAAAENTSEATIDVPFENGGVILPEKGQLKFTQPITVANSEDTPHRSKCGDPVDCGTGNFSESQGDILVGGRGVGLILARTYSAQAAATATSPGSFGYGWTNTFGDRLTIAEGGKQVTLVQANGATVPFSEAGGGAYTAPGWSQDVLSGSPGSGYTLTLPNQAEYRFSGSGRLESLADRNGNETTLSYDEAGRLETVTDPAGRQITLAYNGEGLVETAEDPMGHVVEYAYEEEQLKSVTMPGEESPRWQFDYDSSHRIVTMTDGRGGETTNEYDAQSRVISQEDPAGHVLDFEYSPFHTRVTNEATGSVTDQWFTSDNQPYSITRGFGTPAATTETFSYDVAGRLTAVTDGKGHATEYGYDAQGNRTSARDAEGNETTWAFNGAHDLVSTTTPRGETTTIARDPNGNVESVSRPGPGVSVQTTTFEHDEHGQLESLTDSLERTWTFGYDAAGNQISETDPLGNTKTLEYDENSQLVGMVSPRGNAEGATPAEYTTEIERDAVGRALKVTDPLGHATEYAYDPNGNLTARTNPNGHVTKFAYNAINQQTSIERPNGAVLKTGYDGAGEVTSQTDANEETTTYVRNVLEQPVEIIDPLGRKTTQEFDLAGNLVKVVDPAERETVYSYDKADRLTGIDYSELSTPDVEFDYDADGNLIGMADGSGESAYEYDLLGRLTHSEDGDGDEVDYEYNLAEELVGLVYPNGKAVSRGFDGAGRLQSVTDWLGGTTSFAYDPDSQLESITFPSGTGNVDEFAYDRAGWLSDVSFSAGAETLASVSYERDEAGQIVEEASAGLPGSEETAYGYDINGRLTSAGAASFEYDAADNLTKAPGTTNTYDVASQLETGTGVSYVYDALGERTKSIPGAGPTTTYDYDQAGHLAAVTRPGEGETPAIAETFTYDGRGMMTSRTAGIESHDLSWDWSSRMPMILDDGEASYLYGPNGLPIEQISKAGQPLYLHHDQLGSTRMLTDSEGKAAATFTYDSYGELASRTGSAETRLGYAGQYTLPQSGLQYLRARFYDPATAQFLTRDPLEALTRQPYAYAEDNPLMYVDPGGLGSCILGFIDCDEADDPCDSLASGPMLGLCLVPESAEDPLVNTAAGVGDGSSFGLTSLIRDWMGTNGAVDKCSGWYVGGQIAGTLLDLGILATPTVTSMAGYWADYLATRYPRLAAFLVEHTQDAQKVSNGVRGALEWIARHLGG